MERPARRTGYWYGLLLKSLSAHVLGIRNFIVQMCIENSSSFEALEVGLLACLLD